MAIQITWTNTATGLNETFTWLDDAATARVLAWAKEAYPTSTTDPVTGVTTTAPANNQAACRRAARSWIVGLKDATRKAEKDASLAAVVEPAAITIV